MSNMKLPGVKRIEALEGMLNEQERAAISEALSKLPSDDEIKQRVDTEFGLTALSAEIEAIEKRLSEISEETDRISGRVYSLNRSGNYRSLRSSGYDDRIRRLKEELHGEVLNEIRAKYKSKRQSLWLCETLEEAKAIVGVA